MTQVLSLSFRPKKFSEMVGADKLIGKIRGHFRNGREPMGWMFIGETGAGKTTIAKIMALAYQCTHQEEWGEPCLECQKNRKNFDIFELNSADMGVGDIREVMGGAKYNPRPNSQKRVYILDEVQMLSRESQNYFLKLLEEWPKSTVFILCTTDPEAMIPALRGRCVIYKVPSFGLEETRELVRRAIKKAKGTRNSEDLAEELLEQGVSSPRNILTAVEKYLADESCTPGEAAQAEASEVDTYALCRSLKSGIWKDVAKELQKCNRDDIVAIRASVVGYLKSILLRDTDFSKRTTVIANGIKELAQMGHIERSTQMAGLCAILYEISHAFKEYKR